MTRDPALGSRRRLVGSLLGLALPAALTALLIALGNRLNLVSVALVFLLAVVIVALVGGLLPALVCALVGSALVNYFFTPPLHTWRIEDANNAIALLVFLAVAASVASIVDLAARRRRRLDEQSTQAAALAEADRLRAALLQAVSHDLRAPVAAAKASVSSALDASVSEADRVTLLQGANRSLDRLAGLIANLLDLSRLEAGVLPVRVQPTDVEESIAGALRHLDGPVIVDVSEQLPAVSADPGLLERTLANLIDNALTHAEGPVLVDAAADGPTVRIRVRDRGPGIATDRRERMFVPFQHAGDATVSPGGLGLGLALARGLTEAFGGRVEPETTPGGGLTMVVILPVAP